MSCDFDAVWAGFVPRGGTGGRVCRGLVIGMRGGRGDLGAGGSDAWNFGPGGCEEVAQPLRESCPGPTGGVDAILARVQQFRIPS